MIRKIIHLIVIVLASMVCFSQTNMNKSKPHCYLEKIRSTARGAVYKDTTVLLRNYIDENDDRRIMCNNITNDDKMNNGIWNSKYLKLDIQYQNKLGWFSIVSYKIDNHKDTIVSYFICERKTKNTFEMKRFKITNKKISGINIFPYSVKGFISLEEYDKPHFERID